MIMNFTDDYSFLSNYYEYPVIFEGITYRNSEAAFQAQKTVDPAIRIEFSKLSADEAKIKGRNILLRPDWEDVKVAAMYDVCRAKFSDKTLRDKLLATNHRELIDGNYRNDRFWGKCGGAGENYLGRILMRVRNDFRGFDAEKTVHNILLWIREYFKNNASENTKAVIGISGGKDSSVTAALCARALGADRVLGVLMPCGTQSDIDCSRSLINALGIKSVELNIGDAFETLMSRLGAEIDVTAQARINTPARLRMTALYAVAACVGGRVANTCNLSEDWVGYTTKFGDGAGDFSLLSNLTVTEVVGIGDYLGLPYDLVHKTPIDGLCGKTDEENLGFSYGELDDYIRGFDDLHSKPGLKAKIDRTNAASRHKLEPMPAFKIN